LIYANNKLKITTKKHSFKPYTENIKKKIGICSILGRIRIQNRARIHHPGSGSGSESLLLSTINCSFSINSLLRKIRFTDYIKFRLTLTFGNGKIQSSSNFNFWDNKLLLKLPALPQKAGQPEQPLKCRFFVVC